MWWVPKSVPEMNTNMSITQNTKKFMKVVRKQDNHHESLNAVIHHPLTLLVWVQGPPREPAPSCTPAGAAGASRT